MTLEEKISTLSPELKAKVEEYVDGLRERPKPGSPEHRRAVAELMALAGTIDFYPTYD